MLLRCWSRAIRPRPHIHTRIHTGVGPQERVCDSLRLERCRQTYNPPLGTRPATVSYRIEIRIR